MTSPDAATDARPNRPAEVRAAARSRVLTLARALLPASDGVSDDLVSEIADQANLSMRSFRTLFPTNADLLRAVNDELIRECAERVAAVSHKVEPGSSAENVRAAAEALALAWPMNCASLSIRAHERARALSDQTFRPEVAQIERAYVPALLDAFLSLMARLERRFVWPPVLGVRVVILAYERSFESWILSGGDERNFHTSPFVQETLPQILIGLSTPISVEDPDAG